MYQQVAKLQLRDMTVILEERLLFKLLQWAGIGSPSRLSNTVNRESSEITNLLSYRTAVPVGGHSDTLQLYFELLQLATTELRMSVLTTSQLPEDLKAIKYYLGFPLIKFESPVKLKGYYRSHMLGELNAHADNLIKHYKRVKIS